MAIQNNEIYVQVNHERIKLEGVEKNNFLTEISKLIELQESEKAETQARAEAKAELLERLGITEQEAQLLLS